METRFRIASVAVHPSQPQLVVRGVVSAGSARVGQRVVTPAELDASVRGVAGTPPGSDFASTETILTFQYASADQLTAWRTLCVPGRELVLVGCEWHAELDAVVSQWESGEMIRM